MALAMLISAFLLLSSLLFFVFLGAVQRSSLLSKYEFEQEFGRILALSRIFPGPEGNLSLAQINSQGSFQIQGIGIYDSQGKPLFGLGDYPATQLPPEGSESMVLNRTKGGSLVYIRKIPPIRQFLPSDDPRFRSEQEEHATPDIEKIFPQSDSTSTMPATVYLEARLDSSPMQSSHLWFIYAILEIIFAGLFWMVGRMFVKNTQYRLQLEEQRQLVHLGEAARTLTHEIKNPLSAINLRLSILKKTSADSASEDIQIIQEELDRLNQLSSRIREFLKKPEGEPVPLNLEEYLSDLIKRMPANTDYTNSLPEDQQPIIVMDTERLRSVLENIILNAHEAAPGQSVDVLLRKNRKEYEVEILDRGEGISEEGLQRIFEPFYTTKTTGSGIGLAIARQFVTAVGGRIEYRRLEGGESEPRSSFTIFLPEAEGKDGHHRPARRDGEEI